MTITSRPFDCCSASFPDDAEESSIVADGATAVVCTDRSPVTDSEKQSEMSKPTIIPQLHAKIINDCNSQKKNHSGMDFQSKLTKI